MERKLNKILAYLKSKNTPVLDIPTEEATDSKLVTVSYFNLFTALNGTLISRAIKVSYAYGAHTMYRYQFRLSFL